MTDPTDERQGAIKVMVFAAFLGGTVASPMTLREAVDYIWLGQAFLTLLPWTADPELARMVRTGDVAYERLRPLDTYGFWSPYTCRSKVA